MPISKAIIKKIKSLHQAKFRKVENAFFVEGKKSVEEALQSGWKVLYAYTTESNLSSGNMELITELEMAQISSLSTPSNFLAVMEIPQMALAENSNKVLYLDGVRDPGNLGTILRTADWLGWKNVVLSNDCVELWNPKVIQSTMGSIFKVNVISDEAGTWLTEAHSKGSKIYGADLNGTSIKQELPQFPLVMILGSESHGIRNAAKEFIQQYITIPSSGNAESLNVAIAGSIIMYQWS
jgi:TrmH family RNA methyltransferase